MFGEQTFAQLRTGFMLKEKEIQQLQQMNGTILILLFTLLNREFRTANDPRSFSRSDRRN